MALKDWHKEKYGYSKRIGESHSFRILSILKIKNKYNVDSYVDGANYETEADIMKKFKTKKQALKFARAYMRKH